MVEKHGRSHSEADAAALEPFFAAARAADRGATTALLSAIIADAAEGTAERRAAAAAAPPPARRRGGGTLRAIGGWRGLTALAACAALGFWLGIAGEVSIDTGQTSWSSYDATADGGADDQVGAFYDLASVEG